MAKTTSLYFSIIAALAVSSFGAQTLFAGPKHKSPSRGPASVAPVNTKLSSPKLRDTLVSKSDGMAGLSDLDSVRPDHARGVQLGDGPIKFKLLSGDASPHARPRYYFLQPFP